MHFAELDKLYKNLFADYIKNPHGITWADYILKEKNVVKNHLISLLKSKGVYKTKGKITPILETHKELVDKMWDWENNNTLGISPANYSSGSQQEAIFICPNNPTHPPYRKFIYQVFTLEQDCPYCTGNYGRCITNSFGYLKKNFTVYWDALNNTLTPFHIGIGSPDQVSFLCAQCKKNSLICKARDYKVLRYCDKCKPEIKQNREKRSSILNDEMDKFYDQIWDKFSSGEVLDWEELFCQEIEITVKEFMDTIVRKVRKKKDLEPLDLSSDLIQKEWNLELNSTLGIRPEDYSTGSSQVATFDCMHEANHPPYHTKISNKTLNNSKCPFCTHRRICLQNSFGYKYPNVAKYWSKEKNGEMNPFKIFPGEKQKYYFKCPECGKEEWYIESSNRVKRYACPTCMKGTQSSFPQHAIYYYFNKFVSNQTELSYNLNRDIPKTNILEIDVFLPYFKFGIEYHGEYYHADKEEFDLQKQKDITKRGVYLIIIRESAKKEFKETETQFIHNTKRGFGKEEYFQSLKECIVKSFEVLCSKYPELVSLKGNINGIDIRADALEIQKFLFTPKKNHLFVTHPHLEEYWDFEKNENEGFKPQYFTAGSNNEVNWKCLTCEKECFRRPIKTMSNSENIIGCKSCMAKHMSKVKSDYFKEKSRFEIVPNNITETHPAILNIWCYDKNGDLRPEFLKANASDEINVMWNGKVRYSPVRNIIDSIKRKEISDAKSKKKDENVLKELLKGHSKNKVKDDCKVSLKRVNDVYKKYIESGICKIPKPYFEFKSEIETEFTKLRAHGHNFIGIRKLLRITNEVFEKYKEKLLNENKISPVPKIAPEVIQELLNSNQSIDEISQKLNRSKKTIENYISIYKLVKPEVPFQHIFVTHPHLKEIYDFRKNEEIGIVYSKLTKSSEESVYWICATHGTYKQRVDTKTRAENYLKCSECNKERFVDHVRKTKQEEKYEAKENSLYDVNPELVMKIWIEEKNERGPRCYSANTPRESVWVNIDGEQKYLRIDHLNEFLKKYNKRFEEKEKITKEDLALKEKITELLLQGKPYKTIMSTLKIGQKRFYRLKKELDE